MCLNYWVSWFLLAIDELKVFGKLYAKLSKCEFWLYEVSFIGHVISKS